MKFKRFPAGNSELKANTLCLQLVIGGEDLNSGFLSKETGYVNDICTKKEATSGSRAD